MKIKSLFLFALIAYSFHIFAQRDKYAWEEVYPQVLQQIKAPVFKDVVYNISDYGAVPEKPEMLNHEIINRLIAICSSNGGGTVLVPPGTWHTGPLTLKTGVNLHVEEGATLLFTTDTKYFPNVLTRWEGVDCYNMQPLIYAYGEKDIALTGKGIIDGAAGNENWWKMCGAHHFGWREGDVSQKMGRPKLLQWNNDKTPVSERIFTPADGMRPQLVNFYLCQNVLIEDLTLLRSPFWVIHPVLCENLLVRNVKMINDGPNGDGCNPESCKNVMIEDCFFNTGDDCIAIKSGRNFDGRRWNRLSENIIVRNCKMENGHGGVVIGSEISGGYRNLFIENCKMDSPELDRVVRIKTNNLRGGIIENIYARNIEVGQCKIAVFSINLDYDPKEVGQRGFLPQVRNVYLDNINCQKSGHGIWIRGLEKSVNIENINISNCSFDKVAKGNYLQGKFESINLHKLEINGNVVKHLK